MMLNFKPYMRQIAATLFLIFLVLLGKGQANYGNTVKTTMATYALAKEALDDLVLQLGKGTNTTFKLDLRDTSRTTGIQIIKLDVNLDSSYDARLNRTNADAVLIKSDGQHYLQIAGYYYQSIVNGIYSYLDTLGYRWYAPGDAWTYVPRLNDVRLKLNEVLVPDFQLRSFFGTYGTPRNKAIDPKGIVDHQWQQWAMRNRMGGSYTLKGHSWNEFLWRNFSPLNDHREMMALVNGQRVTPNTSAKFCVSNKQLQELFVADMVAQLKKQMASFPWWNVYTISVEPSDGGGFCECDECKKIGGISNQVFYLANLVAKEFQKISPKAFVNLYAYNTHAAPPTFGLQPNVIIQIIPYGYQHFLKPEEMMAQWKQKTGNLFIYDYYGLPIDNVDQPLKGQPGTFADRIKYWNQQNILGATIESSYSIGCTSPGLYLFARLGWNSSADDKKLLSDYYKNCFGKAASAVEKSEQILATDTLSGECAVAQAMQVLQKQTAKLKLDSNQAACLTGWKAYLHYLKLLHHVLRQDHNTAELATDELLTFTYGTWYTMMVHPFSIAEYLKLHGPTTNYVLQNWDEFKAGQAGSKYNDIKQLTEQEINALFDQDLKELKK